MTTTSWSRRRLRSLLLFSRRVKRLALQVAAGEGLDPDIMVATAYLHDVGRERERRQEGDHAPIGMAAAREVLPVNRRPLLAYAGARADSPAAGSLAARDLFPAAAAAVVDR